MADSPDQDEFQYADEPAPERATTGMAEPGTTPPPAPTGDEAALAAVLLRRGQAYILQFLAADARRKSGLYDPAGDAQQRAFRRAWEQDAERLEDTSRVLRN